jgi:hypothetical protein
MEGDLGGLSGRHGRFRPEIRPAVGVGGDGIFPRRQARQRLFGGAFFVAFDGGGIGSGLTGGREAGRLRRGVGAVGFHKQAAGGLSLDLRLGGLDFLRRLAAPGNTEDEHDREEETRAIQSVHGVGHPTCLIPAVPRATDFF